MPLITHNNNPVESIFLKIVTRIDFQLKKDDDEGRDADLVLRACLFKKKYNIPSTYMTFYGSEKPHATGN